MRKPNLKELPTAEQVMQMIVGTDIELPCLLAIWLSLRISEVRGLQFGDLNENVLTVRRSRMNINGKDVIREVNKTYNSTRKLVVPDYLLKLILSIPHERNEDFIVQQSYQFIYANLTRIAQEHDSGIERFIIREKKPLDKQMIL